MNLQPTITRRQALAFASAWFLQTNSQAATPPLYSPLQALEQQAGGRLGVALLNTRSGACVGHRLHERFGMASTFKLTLAAEILRKVDAGTLRLDQWVPYSQAAMVSHAPVTQQHLAKGGMTVGALAEATQTTSDNTAGNLLLRLLGGPTGLTQLLRASGDGVTRLDREEPAMNLVLAGEEHDTTTPHAMAQTVARYLVGNALSPQSTARLLSWMRATRTGSKRLRAGFPPGWRAGDKTGTAMAKGMPDKYNDIAIAWPNPASKLPPLIVTAYYETAQPEGGGIRDAPQAVLAEVGRIAAAWHRNN